MWDAANAAAYAQIVCTRTQHIGHRNERTTDCALTLIEMFPSEEAQPRD